MTQAELQRLAATIEARPALAEAYSTIASLDDLAERLRADGYDVTDEEVAAAHRAGATLSDEQLDRVAGGVVLEAMLLFGVLGILVMGAATMRGPIIGDD